MRDVLLVEGKMLAKKKKKKEPTLPFFRFFECKYNYITCRLINWYVRLFRDKINQVRLKFFLFSDI